MDLEFSNAVVGVAIPARNYNNRSIPPAERERRATCGSELLSTRTIPRESPVRRSETVQTNQLEVADATSTRNRFARHG